MDNPHEGHRERLREYLRGDSIFFAEPHQLLEGLLFYAAPRCDTNAIAHRLIEHFGSLEAVLSATVEELTTVEQVGQYSADLIHLVGGIWRQRDLPGGSPRRVFNSLSKICSYLMRLFAGATLEQVYILLFDNSMRLLSCLPVCNGSINSAVFHPRLMVEKALMLHASVVVIAHNHPSGVSTPSRNDIDVTEALRTALEMVNIQLLEHIIVAGDGYSAIMRGRNADMLRAEPDGVLLGSMLRSSILSPDALAHFYDDTTVTEPAAARDGGHGQI